MNLQAAIYTRISADQTGEGLGVARQEADCRALCERQGWDVAEVYPENDRSAFNPRKPRPKYAAMLEAARAGRIDVIVAWHPDRLHRQMRELVEFIDLIKATGVKVHTVTAGDYDLSTAAGIMQAEILGSVAAHESAHRSERIRRKLQQNAADGRHHGGSRPYGWNDDRVTLRDDEAAIVREVVDRVLGGESIKSVCRDLTARGVPTASGKTKWYDVTLRSMLGRPRLAGLREYHGEIVGPGKWQPIISAERWHQLHALLSNPARLKTPGRNGERHMLSGVARCGICGELLRVGTGRAYKGVAKRIYRCQRGCIIRDKESLEQFVSAVVVARLTRPDAAGLLVDPGSKATDAALRRVDELRARLNDAAEAYAAGKITLTQMVTINGSVEPQLKEAERRIPTSGRADVLGSLMAADDVTNAWESLPATRQRAVVDLLMTVTVNRTRPGPGFDPASVEIRWREE